MRSSSNLCLRKNFTEFYIFLIGQEIRKLLLISSVLCNQWYSLFNYICCTLYYIILTLLFSLAHGFAVVNIEPSLKKGKYGFFHVFDLYFCLSDPNHYKYCLLTMSVCWLEVSVNEYKIL